MATESLATIQADVEKLAQEVQAKGVSVADPKEIAATAKKMLAALDRLQPHINQAQQAFGGQEQTIKQANDLRNQLNKVIATYGTAK